MRNFVKISHRILQTIIFNMIKKITKPEYLAPTTELVDVLLMEGIAVLSETLDDSTGEDIEWDV